MKSDLATRVVPTNKQSSRQGNKPEQFVIHHTAGGSDKFSLWFLAHGEKKVSANYCILRTGEPVSMVPEEMRAWTTGWTVDKRSITCETVNTTGAPNWEVSAAQLETLSALAADFSIRYGWGRLTRQNVRGHKEFAATGCPGPFIWPRMDAIVARANQIRDEKLNTKPSQPAGPDLSAIDALIKRIIRGELGNGEQRINELKAAGFNDEQIKALAVEVTRRYNALQEEAAPAPKPTTSDLIAIFKMIQSIIRGDWGNGQERVDKLKEAGFNDEQIAALAAAVTREMNKN